MPSSSAALQITVPLSPKVASRQNRTRERILSESARLFLERGFESVSVDHIVSAAEIARSSFYRFFPNREEVLVNIIRPVFENGVTMMGDIAKRPLREIMDGIFDMYLRLWSISPAALRLATHIGGSHFKLFQDAHDAYRRALTDLVRRVEHTGMLLNDSGDYSARLIARSAVPVLEVYREDPRFETLFRQTMRGLLLRKGEK